MTPTLLEWQRKHGITAEAQALKAVEADKLRERIEL
mgnify:CR=1 FL=1|jgi:hypothetical protein|nr:MAG TPA: hypothetical protein [Caudoviricetes sp.]